MWRVVTSALMLWSVVSLTPGAALATFIDLRGANIQFPGSTQVSKDGVYVSVFGSNLSTSPTRLGIDSAGDSDVPDLLDGGNGLAEVMGFLFGPNGAVLDSIVISNFDGDDAGIIHFKGGTNLAIHDGVNLIPFPLGLGATSGHSIQWTGPNSPGATRGFSIDGFNVRLVPEPSSLVLAMCGVASCLVGRRRHCASIKRHHAKKSSGPSP